MRFLFFLIFTLCLLLTACGGSGGSVPDLEADSLEICRIGLAVSMEENTPFFISLISGASNAAELHQAELLVRYAGEDHQMQSEQVLELIETGIDVLILNPVSNQVAWAAESAAVRGIPVITIDRGLTADFISCHVSSDNRSGGMMAGDYLAEILFREGRVVEIRGTEGSSAAFDRGLGFNTAMADFPDIEIVASFTADFSRDSAAEQFAGILEDHDKIDGVFAHNDDMILGAMDAATEAGMHGIVFIGFDAIAEAVEAVENGSLVATVAQRPEEMGYLSIEAAVDLMKGNPVPDTITVDLALIIR